jgi:crossover junction endodeoxyribonuclease RusA
MPSSKMSSPSFKLASGARILDWSEMQGETQIQAAGGDEALFRLWREMIDFPVVARFTVEGEPASKARARFTKRGSKMFAYTPEKTKLAEERVAYLFRASARGYQLDENKTYGIIALFFCGTRQRRDTDNMMKLILDGLNKVAWPDDNQVVEVSARKELVLPPEARTEILVYEVGEVQRFTISCQECGKPVITFQSWADRDRGRKFCSTSCTYEYRRKKNTRICARCGKEFWDRPKSKYCSNECSGYGAGRVTNGK